MKQTPFDELAERLHKKLASSTGPVDAYRVEAIKALQNLQASNHRNRFEALQAFEGAMNCHERHEDDAARLLMYVSGALLSNELCTASWRTLASSMRVVLPPSRHD